MDLLGTGTESWVGFSEETTYGTRDATPTDFMGILSEGFMHDTAQFQTAQSLNYTLPRYSSRQAPVIRASLTQEMFLEGLEVEWKYLLGDHSTTTYDTTNDVYTHIFTVAPRYVPSFANSLDPTHTSLTAHIARGHLSAAGRMYAYMGCLPKSWTLNAPQDGFPQLSSEWLFYDSTEPASPPSGPTGFALDTKYLPYPTLRTIEIARLGSMSWGTISDVLTWQITMNTGINHTFPAGLNGGDPYPLPTTPFYDGHRKITGSFTFFDGSSSVTYDSCTLRYMMDQQLELALRITEYGPTISGAAQRFSMTARSYGVKLLGITGPVTAKGPIERQVTWEAFVPDICADASPGDLLRITTANQNGVFGDYSFT